MSTKLPSGVAALVELADGRRFAALDYDFRAEGFLRARGSTLTQRLTERQDGSVLVQKALDGEPRTFFFPLAQVRSVEVIEAPATGAA